MRRRFHRHRANVRVTRNEATGKVTAKIIKLRVANLHISCPRNNFDVRVGVALEINYPGPVESLESSERKDARIKDRVSYKHQNVSIDLTQVTSEADGSRLHELELEIDPQVLVQQAMLVNEGIPNDYERIVGVFMNYMRVINRVCGDHRDVLYSH